ncbi:hypothetical protein J6590_005226, partial [Homalodisca vitripennis]
LGTTSSATVAGVSTIAISIAPLLIFADTNGSCSRHNLSSFPALSFIITARAGTSSATPSRELASSLPHIYEREGVGERAEEREEQRERRKENERKRDIRCDGEEVSDPPNVCKIKAEMKCSDGVGSPLFSWRYERKFTQNKDHWAFYQSRIKIDIFPLLIPDYALLCGSFHSGSTR